MAILLGGVDAGLEDVDHDVVQALVDLLKAPGQAQRVLAHLQAGGGYAARVGSLGRAEEYAGRLEDLDSLRGGRHVRALSDKLAAVRDQRLGVVAVELVLGRAGQRDVALDAPRTRALGVGAARYALRVLLDAAALDFLDVLDDVQIDAVGIVDKAVGVGHGDDLGAQLGRLLAGVDRYVARAGDRDRLALERGALVREHFVHIVAQAVAGGLGAGERAAEAQALAGQHAGELVLHALVLAVHKADLAAADADVARRHVGELADVAGQLGDKGLAETHDLCVRLALGVEVGTALAAAHGQAGQAVLEALLKAEELDDRCVDRRMEAQAALVGADRGVELHAEAAVDLDLALVVHPRNAEHDHALRLDDALHNAVLLQLRTRLDDRLKALEHFENRLLKLRLVRVALLHGLVHALEVRIGECHLICPPYISAAVSFKSL